MWLWSSDLWPLTEHERWRNKVIIYTFLYKFSHVYTPDRCFTRYFVFSRRIDRTKRKKRNAYKSARESFHCCRVKVPFILSLNDLNVLKNSNELSSRKKIPSNSQTRTRIQHQIKLFDYDISSTTKNEHTHKIQLIGVSRMSCSTTDLPCPFDILTFLALRFGLIFLFLSQLLVPFCLLLFLFSTWIHCLEFYCHCIFD